jgi:hypothetical protein
MKRLQEKANLAPKGFLKTSWLSVVCDGMDWADKAVSAGAAPRKSSPLFATRPGGTAKAQPTPAAGVPSGRGADGIITWGGDRQSGLAPGSFPLSLWDSTSPNPEIHSTIDAIATGSCDAPSQEVGAMPSSRAKLNARLGWLADVGDEASPTLSATVASQLRSDFAHHAFA